MLYLELGRIQTAWLAGGRVLSKGSGKVQGRVFSGASGFAVSFASSGPAAQQLISASLEGPSPLAPALRACFQGPGACSQEGHEQLHIRAGNAENDSFGRNVVFYFKDPERHFNTKLPCSVPVDDI